MKKFLFLALISLFTLSCENISSSDPAKEKAIAEASKSDTEKALEEIKKDGMLVNFHQTLKTFYFPVPAQVYYFGNTGQERVFFFEFSSEKEQMDISTTMSGNGLNIGTQEPLTWISDPHFFRKGKIIAKYVGKDMSIIKVLDKVMGKQYSGTPYKL